MSQADPTGKWPTWVHDQILADALQGLTSPYGISQAQQGSRNADSKWNQLNFNSYVHAMRSPGQSQADAKLKRDRFVLHMMAEACRLLAAGDRLGAPEAFGEAMHPLMDATSPFHTDGDGNSMPWDLSNPFNVTQHVFGEAAAIPTQGQRDAMNAQIRAAYRGP